jgi:hypothetical protein
VRHGRVHAARCSAMTAAKRSVVDGVWVWGLRDWRRGGERRGDCVLRRQSLRGRPVRHWRETRGWRYRCQICRASNTGASGGGKYRELLSVGGRDSRVYSRHGSNTRYQWRQGESRALLGRIACCRIHRGYWHLRHPGGNCRWSRGVDGQVRQRKPRL